MIETFLAMLQMQVCYFSKNVSIAIVFLLKKVQNNFIKHIQATGFCNVVNEKYFIEIVVKDAVEIFAN